MERVGAALSEIRSKAVAADVFHFMFIGERGDSRGRKIFAEGFVEKDKVGEASPDAESGLLKGLKIGLYSLDQRRFSQSTVQMGAYMTSDEVRHIGIFAAIILLQRLIHHAIKPSISNSPEIHFICVVARLRGGIAATSFANGVGNEIAALVTAGARSIRTGIITLRVIAPGDTVKVIVHDDQGQD